MRPHCWLIVYSLMSLWGNFDGTLMILMQTLMIIILFKVLLSETIMFCWCFFAGWLMILRKGIVGTAKNSRQTFMIINSLCNSLANINISLLLQWCFVDYSWWLIDGRAKIPTKDIWTVIFFVLNSETSMLYCCLIDDSLKNIDETLTASF